jgi:hypothetical protein
MDPMGNPQRHDLQPRPRRPRLHRAPLRRVHAPGHAGVYKQNIGQHLKNIFEEGELAPDSVVKNLFTTADDGKNYRTNLYNLDAIISVGYLKEKELAALNNLVEQYLVFAEGQAMRRIPMHMADWIAKLLKHDDAFRVIWRELQPLLTPPPDPPKRQIGFRVEEKSTGYRGKFRASKKQS